LGKIFNQPLFIPALLFILIISSNCTFNKDVKEAKDYMAAGYYDLAAQSLIKRTDEKPDDAEAQFLLGECYLYEGYFNQANEQFIKVIRVSNYKYAPRVGMAYKNAGDKANDNGRYETANNMYQKAIEYGPDLRQEIVEQLYTQGKTYFKKGEYEVAEKQFELVSNLDNVHSQEFSDLLFKVGNSADDNNCLDFYKKAKKYSSIHNDEIGKRLLIIAYSKNTEDEIQNWRKEASGFIEVPLDYQVCIIGSNPFRLKKGELSDLWMRVPSEKNLTVSISSYSNNYEVLNRDMDGNIKVFRIWRGERLPEHLSPDIKIKALERLMGELIIRKKFIDD
jgi:tetratricopeptide (TPR) repeat protein